MKTSFKKLKLSILAISLATVTFAQDFQGKAIYFSKTSMDLDNFGRGDLTEEQKKRISERMKGMFEKTYVLTFNQAESTYKEEERLETPGKSRGFGMMMGNFTGGAQYKNVKDLQVLQEQEFFGKQFLINDKLEQLEWKLEGESKQIGQYVCMKATAIKKVDDMDFLKMRRKPAKEENSETEKDSTKTKDPFEEVEVPKEIEVVAWYTPQIPVNQGPGEYWGLPGLILEINEDRTTILCSKIVINPENKEELKIPSKGKEVTRQEYNDIMMKKMEEMREMYGGRRGKGGGMHIRH